MDLYLYRQCKTPFAWHTSWNQICLYAELFRYLDEFCYKFNKRHLGKNPFERLLIASVTTPWHKTAIQGNIKIAYKNIVLITSQGKQQECVLNTNQYINIAVEKYPVIL